MQIYIIVGEGFNTYGAYSTFEAANKAKRDVYANGYCGGLEVIEDTLSGLESSDE